jgi:hypothetical protein
VFLKTGELGPKWRVFYFRLQSLRRTFYVCRAIPRPASLARENPFLAAIRDRADLLQRFLHRSFLTEAGVRSTTPSATFSIVRIEERDA